LDQRILLSTRMILKKILRLPRYLIPVPQFNFQTWGRIQDEIELMYDDVYADRYPQRFLMYCLQNGRKPDWITRQIREARQWIGEFKATETKT